MSYLRLVAASGFGAAMKKKECITFELFDNKSLLSFCLPKASDKPAVASIEEFCLLLKEGRNKNIPTVEICTPLFIVNFLMKLMSWCF